MMPRLKGMRLETDSRMVGLPLLYAVTERDPVDSMVVLMPAALKAKHDPKVPRFPRWSWHERWPSALVVAVPDPVALRYHLGATWFMHTYHDVLPSVAQLCHELAERSQIPPERVVFYGSSLGGFSAIAAAAHFEGSRAVAEVPQIDVGNWHRSAVSILEQRLLKMPIESFRGRYPERVDLKARLTFAGRVPPIRIITNREDRSIRDQEAFFDWIRTTDLPATGPTDLIVTSETSGHEVLSQERALSFVIP